jgi:phytol kinase
MFLLDLSTSSPIVMRPLSFFLENFPSWSAIIIGGPMSLVWSYACLYLSGYLKKHKGLKTGYTRKVFHFLIFTSVVIIQLIWGTPIVCLFGGMCTLVIFYAIVRGNGHILYEAMARETDAPHRTHYIIVPYFATLIGGLASNIIFGPVAVVGYLVAGFGDAVGEPIGTKFGKHIYRVPSLTSVKAVRSLEGSAAVLISCVIAIIVALILSPDLDFIEWSIVAIPLLGFICVLIEAVTPHGWDNAPLQIVPTWLAALLF